MEDKKIIKIGGNEYKSSEYQEKVFEFIENGVGNLVINASAGSAKTTTLVNCMRFIPADKRVLFVSFNKHIAEEINRRISLPNASARTCSSVGFEICRENGIGLGEVNNEKYPDYIRDNINTLTNYGETKSLGREFSTYMSNIRQVVDLCRYTLSFTQKEISSLMDKYGISPVRDEVDVVRKILQWGESNTDVIDQTDMVWLPNVLNLNTKRLLYDFIFIDEAQDISIAQQALIMKCAKRGVRIVSVGDRNQQINVWCGSDEAAIDKFRNTPNTIQLSLPICYRCGKKIIDFANNFSSDKMIPPSWAEEGEILVGTISEISLGDMVLSRNTSPLIELQQKLLRMNKKVFIQGFKEIKEDYLNLITETHSKNIDINCLTKDGLFPKLYGALIDEIDRMVNVVGMHEDEALSRASVLYLYDNIEAIKVIAEGLNTVDELIEKIKTIFNGDKNDAILLSTVHRAKGLEADNVFLYQPSILDYNVLAVKDWEIKTEQNLRYVAYTRAKKRLIFIPEENDFKHKNPFASSKNFKTEISRIRERISSSPKLASSISPQKVEVKKEESGMTVIAKSQKTKQKGGLKFGNLM